MPENRQMTRTTIKTWYLKMFLYIICPTDCRSTMARICQDFSLKTVEELSRQSITDVFIQINIRQSAPTVINPFLLWEGMYLITSTIGIFVSNRITIFRVTVNILWTNFLINGFNYIIFFKCIVTVIFMLRPGGGSSFHSNVLYFYEGKSRHQNSLINETIQK